VPRGGQVDRGSVVSESVPAWVLVLAVIVALGIGYYAGGGGDYCSKGPQGTSQEIWLWHSTCRQS
jgi:hypothetical protein